MYKVMYTNLHTPTNASSSWHNEVININCKIMFIKFCKY